jgi:hypothetical protein
MALPHTRNRESQNITPDNATAASADHTIFKIFLMCEPFIDITVDLRNKCLLGSFSNSLSFY